MIEFEALASSTAVITINGRLPTPRGHLRDVAQSDAEIFGQLPALRGRLDNNRITISGQLPTLGALLSDSDGIHISGQLPAVSAALSTEAVSVNYIIINGALPTPFVSMRYVSNQKMHIDGQLPALNALFADSAGGHINGRLPQVSAYVGDPPPMDNYFIMVQSPGYAYGYGAVTLGIIADGLAFGEALSLQILARLEDVLRLSDPVASSLTGSNALSDGLVFADVLGAAFYATFADGLVLSDSGSDRLAVLERCIDALVLSGAVSNQLAAIEAITDWMVTADTISNFDALYSDDGLTFGDTVDSRLAAVQALIDGLLLSESVDNTLSMVASLSDGLTFADAAASQAAFVEHMLDGVTFLARLRIGGELYVGYVCHTTLGAFTEYRDIPYNAMCEIGGVFYATGPGGLYRIGGATRDGNAIVSTIKSGLSNFGTGKMKRMPSIYVGYTVDGQAVAKVTTTDPSGVKTTRGYSLRDRTVPNMAEDRVKLGRGTKAVYWQWELEAEGAFSLDTVKLFPMILDRRI